MQNPHNTQVKIGQAVVSCIALNDRRNELEFTWVQFGRGFEPLVGQSLEYDFEQKNAVIRLGDKSAGDKQAICFDHTGKWGEMCNGKQYACLIRWAPGAGLPEILGFGSKEDFDQAVEALKAKKDTFVAGPRYEAPKKSKFKFEVVSEEPEDLNRYRVNALGHIAAGTLKEIVQRMTLAIQDDPTENLLCGIWEVKGSDNRYSKCDRPKIPVPNQMLLDSFRKKPPPPDQTRQKPKPRSTHQWRGNFLYMK